MPKILIVDDDENLLRLMSEYLHLAGFDYDLAFSAAKARGLLKRYGYDMIISDYSMPGESGLDLLRFVSSRHPGTPFLLWTGEDNPRIKRESTRLGAHAYLQKPFYMNELPQTIINLMRRDNQKEAPAA